jgi:hypothetical protein
MRLVLLLEREKYEGHKPDTCRVHEEKEEKQRACCLGYMYYSRDYIIGSAFEFAILHDIQLKFTG